MRAQIFSELFPWTASAAASVTMFMDRKHPVGSESRCEPARSVHILYDRMVWSAAAGAIARMASIEVPLGLWPDLIPSLQRGVTQCSVVFF